MPPEATATAVRAALAGVLDPELDESVLALGFVDAVTVADGVATVTLRLPTAWCAANFAWIMGEDIRAAALGVQGVREARVRLPDHYAGEAIAAGLDGGRTFAAVFGEGTDDGLEPLRATFADKRFLGRQGAVLEGLRSAGVAGANIVGFSVEALAARGAAVPEERGGITRYLALRAERTARPEAEGLAFVTVDGAPLPADGLADYVRTARRVRGSFAANAEHCRLLLGARDAERSPAPAAGRGGRTLIDGLSRAAR